MIPSAFERIESALGVGDHFVDQVIRKLVEHDLSKGANRFGESDKAS